ncbi:MAG: hypothetical protein HWE14_02680 [Flavobacteriia bacterium]|nr:hypothetical protein [Flavobacteriia bacterium]
MRLRKYLVLSAMAAFISVAVACNSGEDKTADPAEEEVSEQSSSEIIMPDPSELALLMRKMFDENMAMKEQIMNGGGAPESFPEEYYNLHTADATEPEKITAVYHAMGDSYLQSMKAVVDAPEGEEVKLFNNMVNTCIACHQSVSCQGPIARIKKLRIPTPDEA